MYFSSDEKRIAFPERQEDRDPMKKPVGKEISSKLEKLSYELRQETDYNSIFSLVKRAVKTFTGKERAGLGLALADLPPQLGAFWEVGGNYIVINKNLLSSLKAANRSPIEINSYVFVILMHEYLHSLGFLDELSTRAVTAKICKGIFEEGHPARLLSEKDPWQVYPFLMHAPAGKWEGVKIVDNFDRDSTSYIV